MQALAREMNLSETTFILPREPELEATYGKRVRTFTTREELPFAGHPTLGTALYLCLGSYQHPRLRRYRDHRSQTRGRVHFVMPAAPESAAQGHFGQLAMVIGGLVTLIAGAARESGLIALSGVVLFFAGLVYGVWRGRLVSAKKIDKEFLFLSGCTPEFLAPFPEWIKPG